MTCEYARLEWMYDYSDCGDEYVCHCDKKKVHIVVDYGTSLEDACDKLCKDCHPCFVCESQPFFRPPHPIIRCGVDPKVSVVQILDLKPTLDNLYEKCPKR